MNLAALFDMQAGECFYCGRPTWLAASGEAMMKAKDRLGLKTRTQVRERAATREHLRRRADGGTNAAGNIVMACASCNNRRGAKPVLLHFANMRREAAHA
jgi:5-methylcytosine-specific restriction endonuclease McrA